MARAVRHTLVFTELWNTAHQYKVHCLRGGARSSKSYSLMQMAFLWLMTGRIGQIYKPTGIFSIVRNVLPALRSTVYKDFGNYLTIQGVASQVDELKTRHEFAFFIKLIKKSKSKYIDEKVSYNISFLQCFPFIFPPEK